MPKYLKVELAVKTGSLFYLDFSRHEGTWEIQKEVKINSERAENSPFFIRRIQKESPAFSKGVRNGDRIIKLNDFEIKGLCFLLSFWDFFRKWENVHARRFETDSLRDGSRKILQMQSYCRKNGQRKELSGILRFLKSRKRIIFLKLLEENRLSDI